MSTTTSQSSDPPTPSPSVTNPSPIPPLPTAPPPIPPRINNAPLPQLNGGPQFTERSLQEQEQEVRRKITTFMCNGPEVKDSYTSGPDLPKSPDRRMSMETQSRFDGGKI